MKIRLLSLCLVAAVNNSSAAAATQCTPIKNGNGTVTMGNTRIKMLTASTSKNWEDSIESVRNFCEKECAAHPETRIWRIPSKADMALIGKCLDPKITYWTSETVGKRRPISEYRGKWMMVYAYRNGQFVEENAHSGGVGYAGIAITGGSPSELRAFAESADEIIAQNADDYRQQGMDTYLHRVEIEGTVERFRAALGADAAEAQRIAQQSALLGGPSKGAIWNCMSEVVPANTSINQVDFSCPNGASMNMTLMQKYKWKITSTERIPTQAENYRSDAYGMRNWNGNGVVISLMLEKQ